MHDLGFKHRKVTPKWARVNGEVERFLCTFKNVIETAKLEHKNYKQELNRQNAEEQPRYSAQHYKSCSGDSAVWQANEDKAT